MRVLESNRVSLLIGGLSLAGELADLWRRVPGWRVARKAMAYRNATVNLRAVARQALKGMAT